MGKAKNTYRRWRRKRTLGMKLEVGVKIGHFSEFFY
jgi:hypothetical protein